MESSQDDSPGLRNALRGTQRCKRGNGPSHAGVGLGLLMVTGKKEK